MTVYCKNCRQNVEYLEQNKSKYCVKCDSKCEQFEVGDVKSKNNQLKRKAEFQQDLRITSVEAYELILKGWVEDLRNIGLSKRFKKNVLNFWKMYRNSVFKKEDNSISMVLTPNFHKRDLEIICGVKYNKKQKRILNHSNYDEKDDSIISNSLLNKSEKLKKKSFVESKQEVDIQNELDSEYKPKLVEPEKFSATSRNIKFGFHKLTKGKLLSFLHLGFLVSRENFTLVELLKAIEQNQVRAKDIRVFLPTEEANDVCNNYKISSVINPSRVGISYYTSKLIRYLDIDTNDIYSTEYIGDILQKFCKSFHLPDKIYQCAENLLIILPPRNTKFNKSLFDSEARVFAIILFVLKLLFILDDYHEYIYDSIKKQSKKKNLFSIIDWLEFYKFRKTFFETFSNLYEFNEKDERIVEFCYRQLDHNNQFNIHDFLNDLPDELPEFANFYSSSLKYIFKQKSYFDEYSNVDLNEKYKRKVKYVSDMADYLVNIKEQVITDLNNRDVEKLNESVQRFILTSKNQLINNKKTDYRGFNRILSKQRKISDFQSKLKMDILKESTYNVLNNPKNYWTVTCDLPNLNEKLDLLSFEKKMQKFPATFLFIFKEFTNILGMNSYKFYLEFLKVEMMFFDFDISSDDNSKKLFYLRRRLRKLW